MKKISIVLATILATLAFSTTTMAGVRGLPASGTVQGECFIGSIATSYTVAEARVAFDAVVYIINSTRKPVAGAKIEGAWRSREGAITSGKCTTGDDGKCSIPHVVRLKEKPDGIPQRGIRIIGVDCPNLEYIYKDNTTFAWAIIN